MSSLQSACVPQSPGQSGGAGRTEGGRTFPLHVQGLVSNGSLQTAGACQVPGIQGAAWVLRGVKREQSSKKSSRVWAHRGNGQSRGDENCSTGCSRAGWAARAGGGSLSASLLLWGGSPTLPCLCSPLETNSPLCPGRGSFGNPSFGISSHPGMLSTGCR